MPAPLEFKLRDGDDFIPLVQLLKVTQLASSGGEAQAMVLDGRVSLNGAVDFRKRAKVRSGDVVTAFGRTVKVL